MLRSDIEKLISHEQTWVDASELLRSNFCAELKHLMYGYDALYDAWVWYISGWYSHEI